MTAQRDPDFDLDAVLSADDGSAAVPVPSRTTTFARPPMSRADERRDRMRRAVRRIVETGHAVLAWRWLPIALFVVPLLVAAVATFTAEPVYEARARVLLEPRARRIVPFRQVNDEAATLNRDLSEPARPGAGPGVDQWGLFQERLRARGLDDRVPRRDLAVRTLTDLQLWDTFAALAPARRVNEADLPAANRGPRGRAIRGMLAGMRVVPVPRSRLVDLVFRSNDPARAQTVANGLAAGFIALTTDARLQKTRDAAAWLDTRVDELRQQLLAAEAALQQFQLEHGDVGRGSRSLATRRLLQLNAAATDARLARIEHEVLHQQLSELGSEGTAVGELSALLNDTGVRRDKEALQALEREEAALSADLGDRHPRLVSVRRAIEDAEVRLQASMDRALEQVSRQYEGARAQENDLRAALEREQAVVLAADRAGLRFGLLQADVQAARRIYTQVLRRRDQVRQATALEISNMRVIDPAERPTRPVSPRHGRNLLMGLATGTLLALFAVYGVEALRRDLASPETVRRRLGLPTLGTLPAVEGAATGEPLRPLRDGESAFAEAVRTLRTQLQFAVPEGDGRVIVVTSTEPGEGKSTVAAHLAAALAAQDERVLLIDADMRRPSAHAFFGVDVEPGLSHVLCGLVSAEGCARSTDFETLMLLPAGAVPPNPAELLLSPRFRELLTTLGERADRIVIDAPPVLAVTDAAVVGHDAAGVLFVVDPGKTNARRARHAIDELRHVRARVLGVVLNRVPPDGARL